MRFLSVDSSGKLQRRNRAIRLEVGRTADLGNAVVIGARHSQ